MFDFACSLDFLIWYTLVFKIKRDDIENLSLSYLTNNKCLNLLELNNIRRNRESVKYIIFTLFSNCVYSLEICVLEINCFTICSSFYCFILLFHLFVSLICFSYLCIIFKLFELRDVTLNNI